MRLRTLMLAASVIALLALPSHAQTEPKAVSLLWLDRLAVSAGANYDWHAGESLTPEPAFAKEFTAGVYAAYVLVDPFAFYGAAVYGVDNKVVRFSPGVHMRVQPHIAATLTYDYYVGVGGTGGVPAFAHEWAAGVTYARQVNRNLLFGASETYSFDNREWRTSVGIRVPLFLGKDS